MPKQYEFAKRLILNYKAFCIQLCKRSFQVQMTPSENTLELYKFCKVDVIADII